MLSKFKKQMWVAALCGAAGLAQAQAWPSKTITIVVPFPPGGTTDVLARAVSTKLSANLGQTVIVDNKPGANSIIGADMAAKASPDGYTVVILGDPGHREVTGLAARVEALDQQRKALREAEKAIARADAVRHEAGRALEAHSAARPLDAPRARPAVAERHRDDQL